MVQELGDVGKVLTNRSPKSDPPERPGILGGLAQRLQDGVRATIVALGQSHAQRLAAIVETSDDAILSIDLDGIIATWNEGAERLFGYTHAEVIGRSVAILIPADRQGEEPQILARIRRGERVHHHETVRLREDGSHVPVSLSVSPIMDGGGTIIGAAKIARDITARKRAEEVLARRIQEQAALYQFTDRLFRAGSVDDVYQAALDAIIAALGCQRASILLFDPSGAMKFVASRGLTDGYRRAVEGHSPWTRESKDPQPISIGDIDAAALDPTLKATVKTEGIRALSFIPLTVRGKLVGKFMTYYDAPHVFTDTDVDLTVTIARQLGFSLERMHGEDERRKAEDGKELLLSESKHRIKNTLATVQAIAAQTLRDIPPAGLQAFIARLHALGEAHELLTRENWDRALLSDVVGRAIKPFETSSDRFIIRGRSVLLPANSSLTLTLCLHELATNAVKYGALSNGTGQVYVTWKVAGKDQARLVRLLWREAGGPPVTKPKRKGFGSLLVEHSGGGDGKSSVEYRPEGLRCQLEFSL
jgi:PAS domain S-box-containing protein